ncbi:MAG: AI-2E family transporter [Chloroflexi bacterium]|nr:AI-2E family transporter [Chloroflexota bacterium]
MSATPRPESRAGDWNPSLRYLVFAALVIGLLAFLWYVRALFTPMVIAGLLAYILSPLVEWLTGRTRWKRALVVSLVYWLGLTVIILVPVLLLPTLLAEFETLAQDLQVIVTNLQRLTARPVNLLGLNLHLGELIPDVTSLVAEGITSLSANAFHLIESTTKNLLWVLVILVATYYLLQDWQQVHRWLVNLPPAVYRADAERLYAEIALVWRGYLRGNLVLMLVVGVTFTLAWLALGIPGAFVLGVIAGILTIIPDLGPFIAGALAAGVALVEGSRVLPISNFWFAVLVFGVYLGLINIKNIWLRPRVFGRSVHMHEGIVFVAIMVAVVLEGIIGALVVIPLLASGAVLVRYLYHRMQGLPPWPDDPPPGAPES